MCLHLTAGLRHSEFLSPRFSCSFWPLANTVRTPAPARSGPWFCWSLGLSAPRDNTWERPETTPHTHCMINWNSQGLNWYLSLYRTFMICLYLSFAHSPVFQLGFLQNGCTRLRTDGWLLVQTESQHVVSTNTKSLNIACCAYFQLQYICIISITYIYIFRRFLLKDWVFCDSEGHVASQRLQTNLWMKLSKGMRWE